MTTRRLMTALALTLGVVLAAPALAEPVPTAPKGPQAKAKRKAQGAAPEQGAVGQRPANHAWKNAPAVREHLASHVQFPATRAAILKTCDGLSDVDAKDKTAIRKTLPARKYKSADEVIKALGL